MDKKQWSEKQLTQKIDGEKIEYAKNSGPKDRLDKIQFFKNRNFCALKIVVILIHCYPNVTKINTGRFRSQVRRILNVRGTVSELGTYGFGARDLRFRSQVRYILSCRVPMEHGDAPELFFKQICSFFNKLVFSEIIFFWIRHFRKAFFVHRYFLSIQITMQTGVMYWYLASSNQTVTRLLRLLLC